MEFWFITTVLQHVAGMKLLLLNQVQMRLLHLEGASFFGHIPRPVEVEMQDTIKNDFSNDELTLFLHSFFML